jgi:hypothetical protein
MRAVALRACARAHCAPAPPRRAFHGSTAARAAAAEDAGAKVANRAAAAAAAAALLAAAYTLWPVPPPARDPHLVGTDTTVSNWRARTLPSTRSPTTTPRAQNPTRNPRHVSALTRAPPRPRAARHAQRTCAGATRTR